MFFNSKSLRVYNIQYEFTNVICAHLEAKYCNLFNVGKRTLLYQHRFGFLNINLRTLVSRRPCSESSLSEDFNVYRTALAYRMYAWLLGHCTVSRIYVFIFIWKSRNLRVVYYYLCTVASRNNKKNTRSRTTCSG